MYASVCFSIIVLVIKVKCFMFVPPGSFVSPRELAAIASFPIDGNVIRIENFQQLYGIVDHLLETVCDCKLTFKFNLIYLSWRD